MRMQSTPAGDKGTGRIKSPPDTRDAGFTLRAMRAAGAIKLPRVVKFKRMYELPPMLPLDQGPTPECPGFSLVTLGIAGPVLQKLGIATVEEANALAERIWRRAQEIDAAEYGWHPTPDDGTTTRSSMKAAQEFGLLGSYLWAETIEDVADFVLHHGPAIAGTPWTDQMSRTGDDGWIEIDDDRINAADVDGHQWCISGGDVRLKCPDGSKGALRMEQTWGRGVFGVGGSGRGFISFANLRKLKIAGGEFVLPVETKLAAVAP